MESSGTLSIDMRSLLAMAIFPDRGTVANCDRWGRRRGSETASLLRAKDVDTSSSVHERLQF